MYTNTMLYILHGKIRIKKKNFAFTSKVILYVFIHFFKCTHVYIFTTFFVRFE